MKRPRCKSCLHYGGDENGYGVCTRWPPKMNFKTPSYPGEYVKVHEGWSCGEHQNFYEWKKFKKEQGQDQ